MEHPKPRLARPLLAGGAAIALAFGGVAVAAAPARAATFTVTTLADSGPGSLRDAVAQANAAGGADTITFQVGLSGSIALLTQLEISEETTIDGTGADITVTRDNTAGDFDLVWVHLPTYQAFTLVDVDIVADGDLPQQRGRGLVVEGDAAGIDIGRVQLTDVNIAGHFAMAGDSGGGAYIAESTYVDILRGSISSNQVDPTQVGGGLRVDGGNFGSLHLTGTHITSNLAGSGGGVAVDEVNGVFVTDALFQLNSAASGEGGALNIYAIALDGVEIGSSAFTENDALIQGGAVGLFDSSGPVLVSASSFSDNRAETGGAVHLAGIGTPSSVTDSTFRANRAEGYGGAIALPTLGIDDELTVSGSTFTENEGDDYGTSIGIETLAGTLIVRNSTLDELLAVGDQFALAIFESLGSAVLTVESSTITGSGGVAIAIHDGAATVVNSILDGRSQPPLGSGGGTGSITYAHSLLTAAPVGGVVDGGGNVISAATGLLGLADNGGPTQTRLLEAGSPAIDAGDPAFAPPPATDQRGAGFARVVNGRIDMGAVEVVPTLPATGGTVPWWLLAVAAAVVVLGVVALVLSRRRNPEA